MRLTTKQPRGARGFSLVELMIVVAITLIVAAVAVPQVLNGMRMLRLRTSATSIAGLIQQTRQRSVRDNRSYAMLSGFMNGQPIAYIDLNNNGQYDTDPVAEPLVVLAPNVRLNPAAPDLAALQALVTPPPSPALNLRVASATQTNHPVFNSRGWACVPPAIGPGPAPIQGCNTVVGGQPVGYVYFVNSTVLQTNGWAAITISPGGRIKSWRCDGNVATACTWR